MKLYRENEETPSDDKNKRVAFTSDLVVTPEDNVKDAIAAFEDIKNYGAYINKASTFFSSKKNKTEIENAVKKHFGPPGFERKTLEKKRGKPFPTKTKPTLDGFILMLNVLTKIFIDKTKKPGEITKTTGQIIKDAGDIITNNPEEAARIFNEKYNSALKLKKDENGTAIIDYNELIKYLENTLGSEYISSLDKPSLLKYKVEGNSIIFPQASNPGKEETKKVIQTVLDNAKIKFSLSKKENIKEIIRQYVKEAIQRA